MNDKAPEVFYCPICGHNVQWVFVPQIGIWGWLHDEVEHTEDDWKALAAGVQ